MKKYIIISLLSFAFFGAKAQCFTIESILADACGEPEGANEMVVLQTNTTINVDDLVFDWPNNSFLGWCTNPSKTALLNAGIVSSCGLLLEPPNGIVPSGKKVLVVTSSDMQVSANSFNGLTDTLYIVYQCAGNTVGHFSNTSTSSRTLTVDYNGNCVGSESVSYFGAGLVGGDGAAVNFDINGNATYYNTGCNAPVPNNNPYWSFPDSICVSYGIIDLNTLIPPTATGVWSGDIENTHYFNTVNKLGTYSITYTVNDPTGCLAAKDSTIVFEVKDYIILNDTSIACDSVSRNGVWITKDTLLELELNNGNPFICNTRINLQYIIKSTDFSLAQNEVTLESDESFTFNILSSNDFTYSFTSTLGASCPTPCSETTVQPIDNAVYSIEVLDEASGCSKVLELNVILNYNSALSFPNTFTPNADGENDIFKVYGEDMASINFKVFSSWGEMVFEGKSLTDAWDGKFKGKPLSSGVYVLQIIGLGKDKVEYKETELLNLVR